MKAQSAEALKTRRIFTRDVIFRRALFSYFENGGNIKKAQELLEQVAYEISVGGKSVIATDGRVIGLQDQKFDDGEGQYTAAAKARLAVPTPSSSERNREGRAQVADKAKDAMPNPVSPSYIKAAKAGAAKVAKTVLDSFKVRDGRAIGDLIFSELEGMRFENEREVFVIRQVMKHTANPASNARVRDLVSPDQLAIFIQRSAELAEV